MGGIESGEQDAALRDWEEAGVEPKSLIHDLGEMRYVKRNRDQVVHLHAEAQALLNEWPESRDDDAIREVHRFSGLEPALRSLEPATNLKLVA